MIKRQKKFNLKGSFLSILSARHSLGFLCANRLHVYIDNAIIYVVFKERNLYVYPCLSLSFCVCTCENVSSQLISQSLFATFIYSSKSKLSFPPFIVMVKNKKRRKWKITCIYVLRNFSQLSNQARKI